MTRLLALIGSAALIVFVLTSPAMGSSTIPPARHELHPGAVLDEAPYISGFECLVHGENYYRQPVCDYYKAVVSSPLMMSTISEEVCFKELATVSVPREYKAEWIYRFIVEPELDEQGYYEGVNMARILSLEGTKNTNWYVTTTVALYDCDAPYELQNKVRTANERRATNGVQRETDRIKQLSQTHNIPILDNEVSELIELHEEKKKLQGDMQQALMKALISADGQVDKEMLTGLTRGGQISGEVIDKFPKDILLRMSEISERVEAIEAPFQAAEKADNIRKQMAELSETSGVPILSSEIEETIALNAEKDRILKRTQMEAKRTWQAEGGPLSTARSPVPNAEDAARLKLIDVRLEEIYAPLNGTK